MSRLALAIFSSTAALLASTVSPIPEPSTYLLMGAGLGALIYARNRMTKKK